MKHKNDLSFNAKFNGKQKFGFRKLSVGLAAVALSTTFFLSNSQLVHADTNTATNQQDSQKSNQEQSNNTIQSTQADPSNQNNQSSTKNSPNQEKTKQQTVEITAFYTDEKGNNASEIKKDESASLMAGQDTINVDIKINQPKLDQNNSLTINLPDTGESKNYQINTGKTKIFSNNAGSQSYWDITAVDHNDNSQLVAV